MSKFLDGTGLSDLITKIKNAFVAKADTTAVTGVGVDSTPTASSTNLVTSGGVHTAIQGKADDSGVVHISGVETITGYKTFNGGAGIADGYGLGFEHEYNGEDAAIYIIQGGSGSDLGWLELGNSYDEVPVGLKNVATPTANTDAANKSYVDSAVSGKESTSNKVTSLSAASTDTQYPSAKAVADYIASKELSDLADVSDTAPTNGQVLLWDGTNEEWKPGTVQGGGSVTDVTVGGTSVVNQQGVAEVPEIPEVVAAQELSIDSTPTANSANLVTSGGVASALSGKQATLVSGTNIKTINSTSLLGSGDIAVSANTPKATTIPAGGLLPNVYYALGTLSGSVSITLAAATDSNILNHYFLSFSALVSSLTITWQGITIWANGSAPELNGGKHYEVSVIDGVGVWMETDGTSQSGGSND